MGKEPRIFYKSIHYDEIEAKNPGELSITNVPLTTCYYIGPSIKRIKWYQFWRWHFIRKYREEQNDAYKRFLWMYGEIKEQRG